MVDPSLNGRAAPPAGASRGIGFPAAARLVAGLALRGSKQHEDASLYTALTRIEAWGTVAEITERS